jgi:putative transposase
MMPRADPRTTRASAAGVTRPPKIGHIVTTLIVTRNPIHMSTLVTPELRTQIIASIKSGTPISQAAEEHHLTRKTISRWMREVGQSAHAATNELYKARKRINFLEHVVLDLVLEQKSQTYKG